MDLSLTPQHVRAASLLRGPGVPTHEARSWAELESRRLVHGGQPLAGAALEPTPSRGGAAAAPT